MSEHLLPLNRTALETALSLSLGPSLLDGTMPLRGFKTEPADPLVGWLVWEYGLEELLPYVVDARRALVEGVQFQRVRGTRAALTMALAWGGADGAFVEEHDDPHLWAMVQIDPGFVPERERARLIVAVARLAMPARSHLVRLYHDYDIRALRADRGQIDRDLLDDWSGVELDGVRQSYRTVHHAHAAIQRRNGLTGTVTEHGVSAHLDRATRLDLWRLDGPGEPTLVTGALLSVQAHHGVRPVTDAPRPAAWRLPVAALGDGVVIDGVNGVLDGYAILDEDADASTLDRGLRLDAAPSWRWMAINALSVGTVGAVMTGIPAPTLAALGVVAEVGWWRSPRRPIQVLDLPAPIGRDAVSGMVGEGGVAFADPDRPWGAGPWLDRPWGEAAAGYVMEELE